MARPGNQNARKAAGAKTRLIQFRVTPELAQCLAARAEGCSISQQARKELEQLFNA